jgi:hypothetical protein
MDEVHVRSFEISTNFYHTMRHHIPENCLENLKSHRREIFLLCKTHIEGTPRPFVFNLEVQNWRKMSSLRCLRQWLPRNQNTEKLWYGNRMCINRKVKWNIWKDRGKHEITTVWRNTLGNWSGTDENRRALGIFLFYVHMYSSLEHSFLPQWFM